MNRPLKSWRIGTRLSLGFGLITALTVLSVAACGWMLVVQDAVFGDVLDQSVPHMTQLQTVGSQVDAVNLAARDALLAKDDAAAAQALSRIEAGRTTIGQQIEGLQVALSQGDDTSRQLAEQLMSESSGVLVTLVKFSRLHKAHRMEQAHALFGQELQAKMQAMSQTIKKAQALQLQHLSEEKAMSRRRLVAALQLGGAVLIAVVGLTGVLAWRLSIGITHPLRQAVRVARHVADGDLSTRVHIDRDDEVGDLLRNMMRMQERLGMLVNGILQTVQNIETTSAELASGNEDLNHRTDRAADNLKHTATAMHQLASSFQQSAQTAKEADQLVSSTSQGVVHSGHVVAQVVSNMQDISTSSARIVDIIGVIDAIAFQTNILALNAAVEAARAGEQGRGFAVVASEVRALAKRSAGAAKEIKTLISTSAEKVQVGSHLVSQAGVKMTALVRQVEQVSDLIRNISQISEEQTHGVQQVNLSVTELDDATRLNAALVQQTSQAGQTLKLETSRLSEAVSAFKLA